MRTIWKTLVSIDDNVTVRLPSGAEPLSCCAHATTEPATPLIEIWWLVETNHTMEDRQVTIAGTGHPLNGRIDGLEFVGTTVHGALRFHVFA